MFLLRRRHLLLPFFSSRSMSTLPTAVVFGGSGLTGSSIVNALLERKEFVRQFPPFLILMSTYSSTNPMRPQQVKVPVRPSSVDKPSTIALRSKGATIIPFDIATSSGDDLEDVIAGADTVICAIVFNKLDLQPKLIDAAKKAGTKRFVPCDFGTPGRRGVRKLHDQVSVSSSFVPRRPFLRSSHLPNIETGYTGLCQG
jgi:hypothetical protein